MNNVPLKYQAIVSLVHPLLNKKICSKCKREFRREIGWKITYEINKEFYLCKICSPDKKSVSNFCTRKNIKIKQFLNS